MQALRILIVEDSGVMRKIVERALRQTGIPIGQVLEAADGSQALDMLRQQKVDLVLSDINMPVMGGLEFVRQLGEVDGALNTPVLMITAEGAESHVRQAIAFGARGYVRKPFTPDEMRRQVLSALRMAT